MVPSSQVCKGNTKDQSSHRSRLLDVGSTVDYGPAVGFILSVPPTVRFFLVVLLPTGAPLKEGSSSVTSEENKFGFPILSLKISIELPVIHPSSQTFYTHSQQCLFSVVTGS